MTILKALIILQVVISLLLSFSILVQQRGAGLGSLAGGSSSGFQSERRGAEKVLHRITIFLGVAFCLNAFIIPIVT